LYGGVGGVLGEEDADRFGLWVSACLLEGPGMGRRRGLGGS
jgi:hypothetical protein